MSRWPTSTRPRSAAPALPRSLEPRPGPSLRRDNQAINLPVALADRSSGVIARGGPASAQKRGSRGLHERCYKKEGCLRLFRKAFWTPSAGAAPIPWFYFATLASNPTGVNTEYTNQGACVADRTAVFPAWAYKTGDPPRLRIKCRRMSGARRAASLSSQPRSFRRQGPFKARTAQLERIDWGVFLSPGAVQAQSSADGRHTHSEARPLRG